MLRKCKIAIFLLAIFSVSFIVSVPNYTKAQAVSAPGPTLYLAIVTGAPKTSIDEIASYGWENAPAEGLFMIYPVLDILANDTWLPDALYSVTPIASNNTYILRMRPGMKWSNGYPLNATSFYDFYLFLAGIGSPPYNIKIINSTTLALQPIPALMGKPGVNSPSWVFGPDTGIMQISAYPPYFEPYIHYIEGNYTELQKYNHTVIGQLTTLLLHGKLVCIYKKSVLLG